MKMMTKKNEKKKESAIRSSERRYYNRTDRSRIKQRQRNNKAGPSKSTIRRLDRWDANRHSLLLYCMRYDIYPCTAVVRRCKPNGKNGLKKSNIAVTGISSL